MIMFKLIQNEMIKILKRRKSLVTVIGFILLIAAIGVGTYKDMQNSKKWSSPAKQIEQEKENIDYLKNYQGVKADDPQIKVAQARIDELKKIQSGEKKFHWKEELTEENKILEQSMNENGTQDKEKIKLDIQSNEYLIQHNITPEKYNFRSVGNQFLLALFNISGAMFLIIGIILFGADMVSGEFTPPTAKFLLTLPVSRGKILFSKFAALLITTIMLIIPIELIAFLIMGALFGFGDMNYPVIVGGRYIYDMTQAAQMGQRPIIMAAGSAHIITMSQYIMKLFMMQIFFMLVAVTFTLLISTVIKNSMVSMSIGIVSVIASLVLQQIPYTKKLTEYIFTTYGDAGTILDGSIAARFNNPNITSSFIAIVFIVWIIASYLIAHIFFTKKDMLI
jgi:ABC-2 type transport system permease protein